MSFNIVLPLYNIKETFDKLQWIGLFPDSLISNILSLSSDNIIELAQPFITPEVIKILHNITSDNQCKFYFNRKISKDLIKSGYYLNIDLLVIIGSPQYPYLLREFPRMDLINPNNNSDIFPIITWLALNNYIPFIIYWIEKGLDLNTYGYELLRIASSYDHLDLVKILLRNEQITYDSEILLEPVLYGHTDVVKCLLQAGAKPTKALVIQATLYCYIDIVKLLLSDPRINPNDFKEDNHFIYTALDEGYYEVAYYVESWIIEHGGRV